jgi:rubredoxin
MRTIDAYELMKKMGVESFKYDNADIRHGFYKSMVLVADAPVVEPQRKTGHWVALDDEYPEDYECDVCGFISEATFGPGGVDGNMYNYCPNCGARMNVG